MLISQVERGRRGFFAILIKTQSYIDLPSLGLEIGALTVILPPYLLFCNIPLFQTYTMRDVFSQHVVTFVEMDKAWVSILLVPVTSTNSLVHYQFVKKFKWILTSVQQFTTQISKFFLEVVSLNFSLACYHGSTDDRFQKSCDFQIVSGCCAVVVVVIRIRTTFFLDV